MTGETPLFLSLCNEMLADEGFSIGDQAQIAKDLGYQGLELAPGTLGENPHTLDLATLKEARRHIESHGLQVTGLHWLLAPYRNASIVDRHKIDETENILLSLIDQCAALGGTVLVHGSPSSRQLPSGISNDEAMELAAGLFARLAHRAHDQGVCYCIEPLSRSETSFINTVEEGVRLVEQVGSPAFQTMIDTSAAGQAEDQSVATLIEQWAPNGSIAHIQVNDTNRGAPGTGNDPFHEIVAALKRVGWDKPIAVEPFRSVINAVATAAIGAATMRAHWQNAIPSQEG